MGIISKIKGWFFRAPSLSITSSVSEAIPKVEIEPSQNTSPVNEVSHQRIIEKNEEKIEKPIQNPDVVHEEQSNNIQPMVIQNTPSQDIPHESTQTDPVQPLATQEIVSSQIIPTNQNSIQPLAIQPESIQPSKDEDKISQKIQPESRVRRSRRSNNSKRSRKKLKENPRS
jgi:hypothetical protein